MKESEDDKSLCVASIESLINQDLDYAYSVHQQRQQNCSLRSPTSVTTD